MSKNDRRIRELQKDLRQLQTVIAMMIEDLDLLNDEPPVRSVVAFGKAAPVNGETAFAANKATSIDNEAASIGRGFEKRQNTHGSIADSGNQFTLSHCGHDLQFAPDRGTP